MRLSDLNKQISIISRTQPSDAKAVCELLKHFECVPGEYLELTSEVGDVEFNVKDIGYFRIWSPEGCIDQDKGYGFTKHLPGSFPFGDNGGCEVLIYWCGSFGTGVYKTQYGNLFPEDCIFLTKSIYNLLVDLEGLENFAL